MARAKRIHHVSIMVTDLEEADNFYGGLLGLSKIHRPDVASIGLWYEVEGTEFHVIRTDTLSGESGRHTAFEVDDLEATLEKIEKRGLPIWGDTPVDGWVRKHCRDPFGNGVELMQPTD